jgi:tRNA modification GTPase
MIDGSQPLSDEDRRVLENIVGKRSILLINKCDLSDFRDASASSCDISEIADSVYKSFAAVIHISAKTGDGIEDLEDVVRKMYAFGDLHADGTLITNARQEGACRASAESMRTAENALKNGYPPDMVLFDVEQGMERIGEILGKNTPNDIVERIFANFCVGK